MENKYLALLMQLIRLKPVTSDVTAVNKAIETIHAFLLEHGVKCTLEQWQTRKILYASRQDGRKPALLLNAHVDVVPPSEESQTVPVVKDGWLYGRGSGDCLGNAVCIIKTLCEADEGASVGAIFTSDEEVGGSTTGYMAEQGYSASRMIGILDHWDRENIGYAQKGILVVKLTAHGRGGHSAEPWLCDNPLDKLMDGYSKLRRKWQNPTAGDQWHKSVSATVLEAGKTLNQIPDEASIFLNIRYIHPDERQQILDLIKTSTNLDLEILEERMPLVVDVNSPEIEILSSIISAYSGSKPGLARMNGATDASWFARSGCTVCMFGIRHENLHARNERMELESFDMYAKVLRDLVNRL